MRIIRGLLAGLCLLPSLAFSAIVINLDQAPGESATAPKVNRSTREPVANYAEGSLIGRLGRPVGSLNLDTNRGKMICTAFLVPGDRLVTAHHCLPGVLNDQDFAPLTLGSVTFVANHGFKGTDAGIETFEVNPTPLETSKELDYSVLKVFGSPTHAFGTLPLSDVVPAVGTPLWLIGHGNADPLSISRESCRMMGKVKDRVAFGHSCLSMGGDSGAPLIDPATGLVVGLQQTSSKGSGVGVAVPMARIVAHSALLSPEPRRETDPGAFDLIEALSASDPQEMLDAIRTLADSAPDPLIRAKAARLLRKMERDMPDPE